MRAKSLFGSFLILSLAVSASAVPVAFEWTQMDISSGFGTISGVIDASSLGGPAAVFVSGVPALPTIHQKDTTGVTPPAGIVGFMTQASSANPGVPNGVHFGWSGSVTLAGGGFEIDVPLVIPSGSSFSYAFDVFDDNGSGNDVQGGDARFAAWIGDDGSGHRHTGSTFSWGAGPDTFTATASGTIGGNGVGDDLGITLSARDGTIFGTNPTIFVDELRWTATLEADENTLRSTNTVPEPSTALLALMAATALFVSRRSHRAWRAQRES